MGKSIKLFSKSLTETDTRKRLAIPAKILSALPDFDGSHAVKLHLLYGIKMWPIVCSIRKTGYKKPVFSCGWRNFIISNNFTVGDELTLYKVLDGSGSSYYRVEVEKPADDKPSGDFSPVNHEDYHGTEIPNFEHEQEQLLFKGDAPIKEEGAVMKLACVADGDLSPLNHEDYHGTKFPNLEHEQEQLLFKGDAPIKDDDVPAPLLDDQVIIPNPPCWIFGINLSDEATSRAQFKTEQESEMELCMDEPPPHSCTKMTKLEEKETSFFGMERHTLDFLGQPTQYAGEVNLDLTLSTSLC